MKKKLKDAVRIIKTARLFARVGLKGMTALKGYRMLRYWVLSSVFKKQVPWLIEFSVTYRCQCKCPHCSVGAYLDKADKKDELTGGEIKNVLTQAARIGIPKVDFFGGEPLLRGDIVDLVGFGAKKGLYMSVTTNAWLLTKEMTAKLKRAGISCINISLDSVSEEKHDSLRGLPGLYQKALAAAMYCHEEGIPCIMSTYLTRNRIKNFAKGKDDDSQLTQIISLAKGLKSSGIRILFPIISGRWEQDRTKELTEEEKRLVIDNIDHSFAFIEGAYSVKNKKKVCQSLSGKMFNISPYGDVQLCVTFTEGFGNVKDIPLKDLLNGMYNHPIYLKNKNGSCCSTGGLKK
jgi:AdoMet-dependent heme synthase